ncbi:hypothetical protein CPB84DRAFT_1367675 [Gymnopilus junonius]|uniref:Uncharacterized protein n=1 Tax=Gymnopilus junonius TaxID=109634 RepID=A0A9P5TRY1_GYMJU|nr:hypothetical protein CPB84DRAFT_1367675 [Gymnopilus junonius]
MNLFLGNIRVGFAHSKYDSQLQISDDKEPRFEETEIHLEISTEILPPTQTGITMFIPISISIPHNPDICTIDGFLATQHRIESYDNFPYKLLVEDAAGNPQFRTEDLKCLTRRNKARKLARLFVTEMGWAIDVSNEDKGLGFSDIAMDTCFDVTIEEWASILCRRCKGLEDLLAPEIRNVRFREPILWAARHWRHGGSPEVHSRQVSSAMKIGVSNPR